MLGNIVFNPRPMYINPECRHYAQFQACAIHKCNHNLTRRKNFPITLKMWVLFATEIHQLPVKTVGMLDTT